MKINGRIIEPKSTLIDYLDQSGNPLRANAGAQRAQGDRRNIKQCDKCSGLVVFVQSSKTDKWYLADVFAYQGEDRDSGQFYYMKNSPHFKTCGTKQNNVTAVEITQEIDRLHRELNDRIDASFEAGEPKEIRLAIKAQYDAKIAQAKGR